MTNLIPFKPENDFILNIPDADIIGEIATGRRKLIDDKNIHPIGVALGPIEFHQLLTQVKRVFPTLTGFEESPVIGNLPVVIGVTAGINYLVAPSDSRKYLAKTFGLE